MVFLSGLMAIVTKGNGKPICQMVVEIVLTKMVIGMLESSWTISDMEKGPSIQRETFLKENSKMTKLKGGCLCKNRMVKNMKENGKKIWNMGKGGIYGLMALNMKESIIMGREGEKDSWYTLTGKLMKESGYKARSMEMANFDQTNKIFLDIGKKVN